MDVKQPIKEPVKKEQTTLTGFGSYFSSEAIPGALPIGRNSPQNPPFGLYAEQLSGSAFTKERHHNLRSWLYRIRPSVVSEKFTLVPSVFSQTQFNAVKNLSPQQLRWKPLEFPNSPTDFFEGIFPWCHNGTPSSQKGASIHLYAANTSHENHFFYNSDAEFLIVPQMGKLLFNTEFGSLTVEPGEIIVIPRGVKFQVMLLEAAARGYICENFGEPFRLPELGIIGANGLANPRDFHYPIASYNEKEGNFHLFIKFQGNLWKTTYQHHPLDVVAWHGNYAPYKYHLRHFNTINTVSFDHPDPSIFTVLSSASDTAGMANIDFVIFPERWLVAMDTFRPPYYHRNIMSEYMGLIYGNYDAKSNDFAPGGSSLHNCMIPHGPDSISYEKGIASDSKKPIHLSHTLAFMFESRYVWKPTEYALNSPLLDTDYVDSWRELKSNFKCLPWQD